MTQPKLRFKREDGTEFPEWEKTKLNSVCDIVGGGTPSTEHEEYWNGNIQWFTPSEIGKSKYVSQSNRAISQIGFERSSARKLPIGTVLLTSRATLGEMAITTTECTTNQGFQSLIPQKICGEYLYYLQPTIKKYCNKKACGSTFNEISKSELGKCIIPLPCPEEQQKIAGFLSSVDEVIAQSEAEVQNLEQQKKAAMQKIFSQEVRFRHEDGTEYPEWEEKMIGDFCSVSTGKSNTQDKIDEGQYPFYVRSPIIEHSDKYLFDEEAVITVGDGVGTGKVFHYVNGKYNLHQRCYRMYDFLYVNARYFYYIFSELFYKRIKSMSAKTSVDSVRMEMITNMSLSIPCLEEQQKIADFLSDYDDAISYAKQELDKWKEHKKGLSQQMFV